MPLSPLEGNSETSSALAIVGILVSLSAFVILYKSYQARGYLQFLGHEAKKGTLQEEDLPLFEMAEQANQRLVEKGLALPLDRKR